MTSSTSWTAAALLAAAALGAQADEYSDSWGPAVGSAAPAITAVDINGDPSSIEALAGEHGLLLFFNRSTDW